MAGTSDDDPLGAEDPTRRRLLPLGPDLVVRVAGNVHVLDRRHLLERTNLIEVRHISSVLRGVDVIAQRLPLGRRRIRIGAEPLEFVGDRLSALDELVQDTSRNRDGLAVANLDECLSRQ